MVSPNIFCLIASALVQGLQLLSVIGSGGVGMCLQGRGTTGLKAGIRGGAMQRRGDTEVLGLDILNPAVRM